MGGILCDNVYIHVNVRIFYSEYLIACFADHLEFERDQNYLSHDEHGKPDKHSLIK